MSAPETVIINGTHFDVIDERDGLIKVRRPNGLKRYWARRLPTSMSPHGAIGAPRARFVQQERSASSIQNRVRRSERTIT